MKTLRLSTYGVEKITKEEAQHINGGSLLSDGLGFIYESVIMAAQAIGRAGKAAWNAMPEDTTNGQWLA